MAAPNAFWDKVDENGAVPHADGVDTPCWLWTASVFENGYGQFWVNPRNVKAHRWAYEALVGPVADGLVLDHLCRVRRCVNPGHLGPVTQLENTRRGREHQKDECTNGNPYDEVNTYRRPDRPGQRECRACKRDAVARHRRSARR